METKIKNATDNSLLDVAKQSLADQLFVIERVEAIVLRPKIKKPVQTSFGTMYD